MRQLFLLVFVCLINSVVSAADYYFSSSTGDDSRSAAEAQNPNTPWRSIDKLNAIFSTLAPGDNVFFKRGDTFFGAIRPTKSGTSGSPIMFSAYGSGNKPIITGFQDVTNWTSIGNGIYETTLSTGYKTLNVATVNNKFQAIGRWPRLNEADGGYIPVASNSGNTSITANLTSGLVSTISSLFNATNFVGGEVVIKKHYWVLDRNIVTAQSGNYIAYSLLDGGNAYSPRSGFGFFFQNHINTLKQFGDWCYESGSRKFRMYFGSQNPSSHTVRVPAVDKLIYISGQSFLTFDNLSFQGANENIFDLFYGHSTVIQQCDLMYAGTDAVNSSLSNNIRIRDNDFNHNNNNAIEIHSYSHYPYIGYNRIKNTGAVAGMGGSGDGTYTAIFTDTYSEEPVIEFNHIDTTGYAGISFMGNGTIVRNNVVDYFCMVKDDGAGIYTFTGQTPVTHKQKIVADNIVINGVGASQYGANGSRPMAHGIYMDDNASQVLMTGNTVAYCASAGFYFHNTHDIVMDRNTSYENATNGEEWNQQMFFYSDSYSNVFRNMTVTNNIIFAKELKAQNAMLMDMRSTVHNDIAQWGTFDNNYYCRPLRTNGATFFSRVPGRNDIVTDLAGWRNAYGKETNSKKEPIEIKDASQIRFEYNDTRNDKVIGLGGTYMTVDGKIYAGSITLKPFSSAILLQTDASNLSPTARAGNDQTITLPNNTVSVDGNASTDPDGSIVSYRWTKESGPNGEVIETPDAPATKLNNLAQGTYVFVLTVTDDKGATGVDKVTIKVNAAPANQNPVANAGANQTITLPTNTATLNGGNSSDADGSVAAYAWTKVSGPAGGTIANPASASTAVSDLQAGVYTFRLTVTDNAGATSTAQVTITVNEEPNENPIANAGANRTITLPENTTTLNGGASTDPDGTITKYAWTKISGPQSFSFANAGAVSTVVSNLTQGVYVFRLTVTDNKGATASANVTVTVASTANQSPTANAGANQTITLPASTVSLSGASSVDPDGTIAAYTWTKISGPASGTITTPAAVSTTVTNLVQGTYVFQLWIRDNNGAEATDNITVIVNAATNVAPVAHAGSSRTITLPANSTTLSGSASTDADGTITKYAWTKVSGPSSGTITNPAAVSTTATSLVQGTYVFQLQVTDNGGATATARVTVTVNAAPNQAPVANAGAARTITLPTSATTLNGSASTDPDGTINKYAWTKVSGPATGTIVSPAAASTVVNNLTIAGTYVFRLTVTDNRAATHTTTVNVVVRAAANKKPVAKAGNDQSILLSEAKTILDGSASSDPDGSIKSYTWKQVDGPNEVNIATPSTVKTDASGFIAGEYYFELTVADNRNAVSKDTVKVEVINNFRSADETVTVYPNPAVNELNIRFFMHKDGNTNLSVMDLSGKILFSQLVESRSGFMNTQIDVSRFARGTYTIVLRDETGGVRSKKFVKI